MNPLKLNALLVSLLTTLAILPAEAQTRNVSFQCGQGGTFEAQVEKDKARVRLDSGKTVELLPVDSRIGRKFSDGRMLLYVNEGEAFIEVNYMMVYSQCMAQQSSVPVSSSK